MKVFFDKFSSFSILIWYHRRILVRPWLFFPFLFPKIQCVVPTVLILMKSLSKEPTWELLLVIFCLRKRCWTSSFFGLWLIQNLYRENQGYNQYRYPSLSLMSWFQITLLQSRQTRSLLQLIYPKKIVCPFSKPLGN